MKKIKLLFVDDHQLILESYKLLTDINNSITVDTSNNFDDAYKLINKNSYDIIFVDISMPKSNELNISNGLEFGIMLRDNLVNSKIAYITSLEDNILIDEIMTHVYPEGFLLKSDCALDIIQIAISDIFGGHTYYSRSLNSKIRISRRFGGEIDDVDKQILKFLNEGIIYKNLHNYINLSQRAIDIRKQKLRRLFNVENKSDIALVNEAKRRELI
jgi:two-component system, NarL family, response regulator NreC